MEANFNKATSVRIYLLQSHSQRRFIKIKTGEFIIYIYINSIIYNILYIIYIVYLLGYAKKGLTKEVGLVMNGLQSCFCLTWTLV